MLEGDGRRGVPSGPLLGVLKECVELATRDNVVLGSMLCRESGWHGMRLDVCQQQDCMLLTLWPCGAIRSMSMKEHGTSNRMPLHSFSSTSSMSRLERCRAVELVRRHRRHAKSATLLYA